MFHFSEVIHEHIFTVKTITKSINILGTNIVVSAIKIPKKNIFKNVLKSVLHLNGIRNLNNEQASAYCK